MLINDKWLHFFAHSTIGFISPEASDHYPVLVQVFQQLYSRPKPFKVFNFWTKHPNFLSTIVEYWHELVMGSPMVILQKKLKRLMFCFKIFNKLHYEDISMKVAKKRKELEAIQLSNVVGVDMIEQVRIISRDLYDLMVVKKSF